MNRRIGRRGTAPSRAWTAPVLESRPLGFWRSDTSVTLVDSAVSQRSDLTGNGYHQTQETAGSRPGQTLVGGGDSYLSFSTADGGDKLSFDAIATPLSRAAGVTVALAWRPLALTGYVLSVAGTGFGILLVASGDRTRFLVGNSSNYGILPALDTSTDYLHVWVFDGSKADNAGRLRIWQNGTEQSITHAGTIPALLPSNMTSAMLGDRSTGGTGPAALREYTSAIWNRAFTDAEVSYVQSAFKRGLLFV